MASNTVGEELDNGGQNQTDAQQIPVALPTPSPAAKPFKYKYPQAAPTPPGEDDETWNKLFTAADSRLYNKHGKNANESKKYRESGETYKLALKMLEEKKHKAATVAGGGSAPSASKTSTPKTAAATAKKTSSTHIKKEPSSSSRDTTPCTDKMTNMSISEKIKSEGRARKAPSAAPSENDVGASSTATTMMGSPAPPPPPPALKAEKPKKKGTAAPIKKKPGPKPKSEDATDTPSSSRRASLTPATRTGHSSEDESNDGGEYCICRGPDDHRMMVYCEGGCRDWYHCSCLKMDVADAKELLDRFICPKCETKEMFTTWKRFCRYNNVGKFLKDPNNPPCRKAARVSDDPPSKYCSDEHNTAFWVFVRDHLARQDDEPSRGGRLNVGEVGWILSQGLNAAGIHALGSKPKMPIKEGADPNRAPGLDYLTDEEEKQLQDILDRQNTIEVKLLGFRNQEKLRGMILGRAEKAAEHLGLKSVKELCGYDNRLSFNEAQFARYSQTEEWKRAYESGTLGPRTAETKDINAHTLMPGQVATEPVADDAINNICIKKKCLKHMGWAAVHKDDFSYSYNLLAVEHKKLSIKRAEIVEDAETREAMKPEYSDNITIQCF